MDAIIRRGMVVCFGTLILNACASVGTVHDYCQIAHPIYLQKGEAAKLSDATARAILTNNETWAKVCQ